MKLDDLPDWARDLAAEVSKAAGPVSAAEQRGTASWPLFLDAATVGAFLPRELPAHDLAATDRKAAEKEVLRFAEVTQEPGGTKWLLTNEARRAVLSVSAPEEIEEAVARTSAFFSDRITVALHNCMRRTPNLDFTSMTEKDLEATRLAVTWLHGLDKVVLPPVEELDRQLELQRLLAPFERMTGKVSSAATRSAETLPDRFFGRDDEMETLRAYVGVIAAGTFTARVQRGFGVVARAFTGRKPKVVWGTGGVGKTTLIAKFMLEHARATLPFPFAYLDFDRSTISARNRAALLAEMCDQVMVQFPRLANSMHGLRDELLTIARRIDVSSDGDRITAIEEHARTFRRLIDASFDDDRPFLLVFDTFEIVQYGPDQIIALEKLVSALAGGTLDTWGRLRLIISGRQEIKSFLGTVDPLALGALDKEGSARMLAALAADAGKPIPPDRARDLVSAIAKHVRDRSNTGVRPLRLRLIGELFRQEQADGPSVVSSLLLDLSRPPGKQGAVGRALVDGILVRRILDHVRDGRVRALADPGLVVRRITREVVSEVMTRGTQKPNEEGTEPADTADIDPWVVTQEEAASIFEAFRTEVSLVEPDGEALRHRQDVRMDMLPLIQARRPLGFERIHRLAFSYFMKKTLENRDDLAAAAETVYHALWLKMPLGEIDRFWPRNNVTRIDVAEFEDDSREAIYIRAKNNSPLIAEEIKQLTVPIALDWLQSRAADLLIQERLDSVVPLLRAVGGDDYANFDKRRDVAPLAARILYRAALWEETSSLLKRHVRTRMRHDATSTSLLRTWSTVLAKSGAEPAWLAALLPLAEALSEPLIRTELLAHIAIGLRDSEAWSNVRLKSRDLLRRSYESVPRGMWRRQPRILRLVVAAGRLDDDRMVRLYVEACDQLPHDREAASAVGEILGLTVELSDLNRIWQERRSDIAKRAYDFPRSIRILAAVDHADWLVPLSNAFSRDFDRYAKDFLKSAESAVPRDRMKEVQLAMSRRDSQSLLELIADHGGLVDLLTRVSDRSDTLLPSTPPVIARALLRWRRLSMSDIQTSSAGRPGSSVETLVSRADWNDLTRRLLAYTEGKMRRSAFMRRSDAGRIVQSAVLNVLQQHRNVVAGKSLFLVVAEVIDTLLPAPIVESKGVVEEFADTIDWEDLTRRLVAYANWRLGRFGSAARDYDEPADYVQEAVRLFLSGRRQYDPNLSIFVFFCGVLNSLISHDGDRVRRARGAHYDGGDTAEDDVGEQLSSGDDFEADFLSRDELERFIATLEPDLAEYATKRAEGTWSTAKEFAAALGTTIEQIYNMDRRLRRRRQERLRR